MESPRLDILTLTKTTLRDEINQNFGKFKISKSREKFSRLGGGIGIIYDETKVFLIEEMELNTNKVEGEDIAAYRCQGTKEYSKSKNRDFIIIVAYMSVEGLKSEENHEKYRIILDFIDGYKRENIILAGDMNGHTGLLGESIYKNGNTLLNFAEISNFEILNHTIAKGKVTWKGIDFKSAIDYFLVNQKARELVVYMIVDEKGILDFDPDHNVLILKYSAKNNILKKNKEKRAKCCSEFTWLIRGLDYDNFQAYLSKLDSMYESYNECTMNDEITNLTAKSHLKKLKLIIKDLKKKVGGTRILRCQ